MKKTKTFKLSSLLLWVVLGLSLIHFTFLMLGLFNVLEQSFLERKSFNYILSFVLVALCLVLYLLLMLIENKKKLVMPEWFKCVFYVAFYTFTNIYYYFGFYGSLAGLIVFYACLAFVLNIVALSIFFNSQKGESNVVKSNNSFTTLTTFTYAVSFGAIIETIISAFKIIFIKESVFASLSMFIIDMCIIVLVSIVMAIVFSASLSKKKKLINNCLIKYYKEAK